MPPPYNIVRVLGNDLPPRHAPGQTRRNLEFILRHEGCWPELAKSWIVNRIWDRDEEAWIIHLLESHGQPYERLPFDLGDYGKQPFMYEAQTTPFSREYRGMIQARRMRADLHARRHRANYAINNNGGRNAALRWARRSSQWILPWDGNCFLTDGAWSQIKQTVEACSHLPYFVVPMARVTDNRQLLDVGFHPKAAEEPQLIFRHDALEEFNPDRPYGRRPKVDLLWRLGVPGAWDKFEDDPWDPPRPALSQEAGQFAWAGWVARLESGHANLEKPTRWSGWRRGQTRTASIISALDQLDAKVIEETLLEGPLFFERARLDTAAKTWANGGGPLSQPVAAFMSNVASNSQTTLQSRWQIAITKTLAWQISSQKQHARAAAAACRPCLLNSKSLPPTAEDLALSLDALHLLHGGGFLSDRELAGFRHNLTRSLARWIGGWLGLRRSLRTDSDALRHDTRSAIVAAFLSRHDDLAAILRRSHARFAWHFVDGHHSESSSLDRRREWQLLARMAEKSGLGRFPEVGARTPLGRVDTALVASNPDLTFCIFTCLPPAEGLDVQDNATPTSAAAMSIKSARKPAIGRLP
jgi:hypothetical protein